MSSVWITLLTNSCRRRVIHWAFKEGPQWEINAVCPALCKDLWEFINCGLNWFSLDAIEAGGYPLKREVHNSW